MVPVSFRSHICKDTYEVEKRIGITAVPSPESRYQAIKRSEQKYLVALFGMPI